jgi:uracil-DNA glycosylase
MPHHPSWDPLFGAYDINLDGLNAYPPPQLVFRAFTMPVGAIRLVILGQDPYHGPGQAHGLAFSVPPGVPKPPSLQNICKELAAEFPERNYRFPSGDLSPWAEQGIFLLNAALTVAPGSPNSHATIWSEFTDDVIKFISENTNAVFLLLGAFAKSKSKFIKNQARVISGVHPSPLAAHKGFFGSNVFKTVEALIGPINWESDHGSVSIGAPEKETHLIVTSQYHSACNL